jgi:hypothetical protein
VGGVHGAWQAIAANLDGSHQVQPQQCQVSQVILGQPVATKVGVQTTQSTESARPDTHAFEIGQHDAVSIAYDNVLDIAFAIDQHADLPADLGRQLGQLPGKLVSDDMSWWNAPVVQLFQAVNLIGFQSLNVAFDRANRRYLLGRLAAAIGILHQS